MSDDMLDEFYELMEGKSLLELATIMNEVRVSLDAAKQIKTNLQKRYDALRLNLIPAAMDEDGISNITIDGIGRIGLTGDLYASIPADHREEAWKWLKENDLGDIIKETVNAGTLKATMKSIMKKGVEIPETIFKVTPYTRASITKK